METPPCRRLAHFRTAGDGWLVTVLLLVACGRAQPGSEVPPAVAADATLPGQAAVRVEPWTDRRWMLLTETLQPQHAVTEPDRQLVWLDRDLQVAREYHPPAGHFLIDAAVHPGGEATALELEPGPRDDVFTRPLRAWVRRFLPDGTATSVVLDPPSPGGTQRALFSLDRARVAASGEDALVAVRWADDSVEVHRVEFRDGALRDLWRTVVEPPANLLSTGIIGGGFDNFHQGDRTAFVYLDVDTTGGVHVVVPSTEDVLPAHDAFFGEHLLDAADPEHFDFGVGIVTRVGPDGARRGSVLSGLGTGKRLLNIRSAGGWLWLVGRVRTGEEPTSWDGWLQAMDASTGRVQVEHVIDVDGGDMFWDVAPLDDGTLLAVGSTHYSQNPNGLSVSDVRDDLVVLVGPDGALERRIALPGGPPARGNEVTSVRVVDGSALFVGLQNGPGTHAPVFSDAFARVRPLPAAVSP